MGPPSTHQFELQELLASGSSASVYRCEDKSAGRQLACKMSRREECRWPWNHVLDMYERESRLLRRVQGHPNVIQYAGLYREPNRVYMVMELVNGGDLHTVLTKQRCLPEEVARAAFTQLVSAVDHLHANGMVHRDIKLENVLYDQTANPPVIKLCDLGNSMLLEQPSHGNFKGTNGYTAPEIGTGAPVHWTPKADVWALGVVLYAMLGGYLPFDDSRGRHMHTQYLDFSNAAWWDISVDAKLLIQSMLTPSTAERATLDDVIDSAWLARVDPSRLPTPMAPPPLHPVASMPVINDNSVESNRLSLRSYRKPSGKESAPGSSRGGGSSTSISEDETVVAMDASTSLRKGIVRPPTMGGSRFSKVSASCNNLAALSSGSRPSANLPTGGATGGAVPRQMAVDKTPQTADAQQPVASPTGRVAEDARLSDILSRCREQGMRMSITVARSVGAASKP